LRLTPDLLAEGIIAGDAVLILEPVLHAAGRVLPFELDQDVRAAGGDDLAKLNERCVSDRLEDIHGAGFQRRV